MTDIKYIYGFKIPNRVCVALSRARMGLYIISNLDFLAENCPLWDKIRTNAKDVNAVSNELVVKCQMHGREQVCVAPCSNNKLTLLFPR